MAGLHVTLQLMNKLYGHEQGRGDHVCVFVCVCLYVIAVFIHYLYMDHLRKKESSAYFINSMTDTLILSAMCRGDFTLLEYNT